MIVIDRLGTFRYDAELYCASTSRFVDDVQALVEHACRQPPRWQRSLRWYERWSS